MANFKDKDANVSPATSTASLRSHLLDRSPSLSSTREDKWPELLLSRPDKSYYYSAKSEYVLHINIIIGLNVINPITLFPLKNIFIFYSIIML